MKVYTLRPQGFQRERRQVIKRGVALGGLMLAFMAILLWFLSTMDQGPFADGRASAWWLFLFAAGLVLFSIVRAVRRSLKVLREGWDSYELGLGPDFVLRKQVNMPEVEIAREEVTAIQEAPPNKTPTGMVIKTSDRQRFISVPEALEGYEIVKAQLAQWRELEPLPTRKLIALQTIYWLLIPAAFIIILVSSNSWLVLTTGILLIGFTAFGLVELRRSMNVDSRIKNMRTMVIGLILIIVMVALRVYVVFAHIQRQ